MAASTAIQVVRSVSALFDQFRQEIDDHNDTRERLIKVFISVTLSTELDLKFSFERLAAMSPISPRRLFFFSIAWR
jgi:hypothetical protein